MMPPPENITPEMAMTALDRYLADQEAIYTLTAEDIRSMLEEKDYDAKAVFRQCLGRFRPATDEDMRNFIMLVTLLSNTLQLSRNRGNLPPYQPGPVEQALTDDFFTYMESQFDPDDYETSQTRQEAIDTLKEKWMTTPQKELSNKTPRDVVAEERRAAGAKETKWDFQLSIEGFGDLDQERDRSLFEQGVAALKGGDAKKAEDLFRTLTQEYPRNHTGWGNLGLALASQGKKDEAVSALKQALKVNPEYKLAAQNLESISQSSLEDLRQHDMTRKASVLHIGTKEAAYVEWGPNVTSDIAQDTPAVRDAVTFLNYLTTHKGVKLTEKRELLTRKHVRKLNESLAYPDPIGLPTADDTEDYLFYFRDEYEFPTIWRIHSLLEVLGLIRYHKNKCVITKKGKSFLKESPRDQYIELLFHYFLQVDWEAMHFVDEPQVNILQETAAAVLDASLNLQAEQRRYQRLSLNPKPVAIGENTKAPRNHNLEEKYLWEPLAWFDLLRLKYKDDNIVSVCPTRLGIVILPTLAGA